MVMRPGAYNIVEQSAGYDAYPTTLSIIEFLRVVWREESLPAREVTVTGLDTLLVGVPQDQQREVARFIRDALQDVANLMFNRNQTVQFVVRGKIDRAQDFEIRQPSGEYANLTAIFGNRLQQEANDWLVAPLSI